MNWAQITILALYSAGILISANQHGKDKGQYNFWISLISSAIGLFILYKAGTFN